MGLCKGKQSVAVALNGPLIANDLQLMTRATLDGAGLAYLMDEYAAPYLAAGETWRSGRLVCAFRRLLSVLPQPAAAASRARGTHRRPPRRRVRPANSRSKIGLIIEGPTGPWGRAKMAR